MYTCHACSVFSHIYCILCHVVYNLISSIHYCTGTLLPYSYYSLGIRFPHFKLSLYMYMPYRVVTASISIVQITCIQTFPNTAMILCISRS